MVELDLYSPLSLHGVHRHIVLSKASWYIGVLLHTS
jgi:hypothetical protein